MNILKGSRGGGALSVQITGTDLLLGRLMSSEPTTAYTSQTEFTTSSWSATAYQEAAVLKIDPAASCWATLAGKTVSAMTLALYRTGGYMSESSTLYVAKCLRTVVVGGSSQMTWNQYSTGNNWGTAGASNAADVDLSLMGAIGLTDTVTAMFTSSTANFVAAMQAWVNASGVNNGFLLFPSFFADYHTWSGPTGANPPILTVTYS